jgi:pyruvate/2-oxoglutarate dehydrogenase complex dihydrolipoamide acyltransferase (E2) component
MMRDKLKFWETWDYQNPGVSARSHMEGYLDGSTVDVDTLIGRLEEYGSTEPWLTKEERAQRASLAQSRSEVKPEEEDGKVKLEEQEEEMQDIPDTPLPQN